MENSLLAIINDRLSEIAEKGEVIDRYYNPGNVFDVVHILMTNDDEPPVEAVKSMVGDAELHLHNLPAGKTLFLTSLGWRPKLLRPWAESGVELARQINPDLIRCHGAHLNAFVANRIKRELDIPYLVSMHLNQKEDRRRKPRGIKDWIISHAQYSMERLTLRKADLVLPVYKPIVPYLEDLGVQHYEVCYNTINPKNLREKTSYELHEPVKLVSVGRQFKYKNPDQIIRALSDLENVHYTLYGDGPYHDYLMDVAAELGVGNQVKFESSIPNDTLCRSLPEFDMFVTHTEYWELSKSILEPLLTGLPVILNKRSGEHVPELNDNICKRVENTPEAYASVIKTLIRQGSQRKQLGQSAYEESRQRWSPRKTEEKYRKVYRLFLEKSPAEARRILSED